MTQDEGKESTRPHKHSSKRIRAQVDYQAKTVKYGRITLGIPTGFNQCLENVTREILREQPKDIPAFLACYFTRLAENQRQGFPLSNLVTERVVEVKRSVDEGVQKGNEVADCGVETQDIEDAKLVEKEQDQTVEEPAGPAASAANLSLEQQEALHHEQDDEVVVSTVNLQEEESLPDLSPENITEEQKKAMDLLNHCVIKKKASKIGGGGFFKKTLPKEPLDHHDEEEPKEEEPKDDNEGETEPKDEPTNSGSAPNIRCSQELPPSETVRAQSHPSVNKDIDEIDCTKPIDLTGEVDSLNSKISEKQLSQIASSIKMCTADAIVGESVLELANESNTQINIDEQEGQAMEEAEARKEGTPAQEEEVPAQEEEAPTQEEEAVAQEEEAPAQEEEAVTQEEEAPAQEAQAPEEEVVAPEEEAPAQEAQCPEEEAAAQDETQEEEAQEAQENEAQDEEAETEDAPAQENEVSAQEEETSAQEDKVPAQEEEVPNQEEEAQDKNQADLNTTVIEKTESLSNADKNEEIAE